MKDPAFLFYPNDYLGGTLGMTLEEKGAYIELLMVQFNRGHLSDKIIHNLIGELWNSLSDKFIKDDTGLWYNKRLEYEQEKRKNYSESRRNNVSKNNICKSYESDMNETCIYIFKDYDTGYIKIGASLNPKNRLSTIKSRQNKPNVKIIATFSDCTLLDEKNIHEKFKEFNIKGDWFNIDENIVIEHIVKHMNKHMNKHMSSHMENENENENKDKNEVEILSNFPFNEFWDLYDKKVGDKNKIKKKYDSVCESDRIRIRDHIEKYIISQPDKQYRKNPETYLNNKSWNDEIIYKNGTNRNGKQQNGASWEEITDVLKSTFDFKK